MKKFLPNLFAAIGVVVGIIVLILGISLLAQDTGTRQDISTTFGGDFYTYSYEATARAANNVLALGDVLAQGMGYLLIAFGLFDICLFGQKVLRGMFLKAAKQEKAPFANESIEQ